MAAIPAIYCTLANGRRGVKCGEGIQPGAIVTIRLTSGGTAQEIINRIERCADGLAYCAIGEYPSDDPRPEYMQEFQSLPRHNRVQCIGCNRWLLPGESCFHCGE